MSSAQFVGKSASAIKQARETLPWLVKFAEAHRTITYGQLSLLIGRVNPHTVVPRILGRIGRSLERISSDIPPIQLLVVNEKDHIPGRSGLLGFLIKDKKLFERLSLEDKRHLWEVAKERVFDWDWRSVLGAFGLSPVSINQPPLQEIEDEIDAIRSKAAHESEEHRHLKNYIATHPHAIGLKHCGTGDVEHPILSGDRLDILFDVPGQWICVEIKGKHSPELDILRGLFQCVKYKAVLEAQRHCDQSNEKLPDVRVVLVLGAEFPVSLEPLRQILGIEVKANVIVPSHVSSSSG